MEQVIAKALNQLFSNPLKFVPVNNSSPKVLPGAHEPPEGQQGASNSALYRATAFDSEQLAHLPFMELFSSGEFPSVVAPRRCSSCAFLFDVGYRCRHR